MIKIGTNFLYEGPLFLDERHGLAASKLDLLEWSIPIPEGFEVYLATENDPAWYTYKSNLNLPDTGHFERRLDQAYVDDVAGDINSRITIEVNNIWEAIRNIHIPTNLKIVVVQSNAGKYPGGTVTPGITFRLTNFDNPIPYSEILDVLIDNTSVYGDLSVGEDGYTMAWTNGVSIGSTHTYTLTIEWGDSEITKDFTYTFQPYDWSKYFGVSSVASLASISELQPSTPTIEGWGTVPVAFEGTLDCGVSGGSYPYYIIPKSAYNPATFKMYVGGFRTTDFVTIDITIDSVVYTAIRTGYKQTGTLQIRYE